MIKNKQKKDQKTKNLVRFLCIVGVMSFLTAEYYFFVKDLKKNPSEKQKTELKSSEPKEVSTTKSDVDLTYDYVRRYYEGFRGYLNYGLWDGSPCVKIGFGIPITLKELKELPFDKTNGDEMNFLRKAEDIYNSVLTGESMDHTLRIPDRAIRTHTKSFLEQREAYYADLCKAYGFEYKDTPHQVRAAIFSIDAATGFKNGRKGIGSYEKLFGAIAERNWEKAAGESSVSEKVFKENNPHITEGAVTIFNNSMRSLFNSLDEDNQKSVQQQILLKQQGKSL